MYNSAVYIIQCACYENLSIIIYQSERTNLSLRHRETVIITVTYKKRGRHNLVFTAPKIVDIELLFNEHC